MHRKGGVWGTEKHRPGFIKSWVFDTFLFSCVVPVGQGGFSRLPPPAALHEVWELRVHFCVHGLVGHAGDGAMMTWHG